MRQFFNDDCEYIVEDCKRYPIIPVLLVFLILLGITLITLSFYYLAESYVMIPIGLSLLFFVICVFVAPFIVRALLNTMHYLRSLKIQVKVKDKKMKNKKSPLTSTRKQHYNPLASGISI